MAKVTIPELMQAKREGRRIVSITAYDYTTARIADRAGVDMILVGDSGSGYLLGAKDYNECTMEEMLIMTRSVARAAEHAFVTGDLPFMSYQVNIEEAVRNAGRFIKEAGADAVKLEGGEAYAPTIAAIVKAGILVLGHMGYTPMTSMGLGLVGYDQAPETDVNALIRDAKALEKAGCFGLVLTRINAENADQISGAVQIPTFGAGRMSHGTVGVIDGLLGMSEQYLDGGKSRYGPVARALFDAMSAYVSDARASKVLTNIGAD